MMGRVDKLARVTAVPLTLRSVAFLSAWVGLWLAAPHQAAEVRYALLMAVIAAVAGLAPGSRFVDAVMLAIVALWVVTTLGLGEPATPGRTFATACALYLAHSAAAFAAMLPYDAIVDAQVLLRWAARSAMVLAAGAAVTVIVVAIATPLADNPSLLALLAGLAIVVGLVAVLTFRR